VPLSIVPAAVAYCSCYCARYFITASLL